jgi:hypothetical protein
MEMNFSPEKTLDEQAAMLRSIKIGSIVEKTKTIIFKEGVSEKLQEIIGSNFDFGEGKNIEELLKNNLGNTSPSELETIENRLEELLKKEKSE